jgi:hypothetical protein
MRKSPGLFFVLFFLAACQPIQKITPTVDAPGTFTAVARTFVVNTAAPSATPFQPIRLTATPSITHTPSSTQTPSITPLIPGYITWTPSTCDYSAFIQDVTIPDGTFLAPGTPFTKIWRISNIGSCTWTSEYRFQYISGDPMGADTIYLSTAVAPGETFDLALNMIAPEIPEDYSNFWRLRNPAGEIFGTTFSAVITVSSEVQLEEESTETAEPENEESQETAEPSS